MFDNPPMLKAIFISSATGFAEARTRQQHLLCHTLIHCIKRDYGRTTFRIENSIHGREGGFRDYSPIARQLVHFVQEPGILAPRRRLVVVQLHLDTGDFIGSLKSVMAAVFVSNLFISLMLTII